MREGCVVAACASGPGGVPGFPVRALRGAFDGLVVAVRSRAVTLSYVVAALSGGLRCC